MSPQQRRIVEALDRAGDWVEGEALVAQAGAASYGSLKVQIHKLRQAGVPIVARYGGGYRLAPTAQATE